MKKVICWILMCLCIFLFSGCLGCWNKSVTGADGTEYESYQEACRHQDFVAAYDWIDLNHGSDNDKDYVFNEELLFLTSLGTEEASNRIVYLLAEYHIPGVPVKENSYNSEEDETYQNAKDYVEGITRFNKRCDKVIDMTIAQENITLAMKILNLYKQDIDYGDYNDNDWGLTIEVHCFSWDSKVDAIEKVASFIAGKSDSNNDDIVNLLKGFPFEGTKPSSEILSYRVSDDALQYEQSLIRYQGLCDKFLEHAIRNGNKDLALIILNLYKEDFRIYHGNYGDSKAPDGTLVGIRDYIWYNNDSKKAALQKYNEAVKAGAFK